MSLAQLLLHPVRLRIVQQFLGGRHLTTAELRRRLEDVPVASLYRHVARLLDGGVLEVVGERQVRGTAERTLALRESSAVVGAEEASSMTVEDHRQAFLPFVAGLVADFERYLAGPEVDVGRDLVGYRQVGLHLTDAELVELAGELSEVVARRLPLGAGPGRRLRILTTILVPSDDPPAHVAPTDSPTPG